MFRAEVHVPGMFSQDRKVGIERVLRSSSFSFDTSPKIAMWILKTGYKEELY